MSAIDTKIGYRGNIPCHDSRFFVKMAYGGTGLYRVILLAIVRMAEFQ